MNKKKKRVVLQSMCDIKRLTIEELIIAVKHVSNLILVFYWLLDTLVVHNNILQL